MNDKRKGVIYSIEALNIIWARVDQKIKENTFVLIVGRNKEETIKFADKIPVLVTATKTLYYPFSIMDGSSLVGIPASVAGFAD